MKSDVSELCGRRQEHHWAIDPLRVSSGRGESFQLPGKPGLLSALGTVQVARCTGGGNRDGGTVVTCHMQAPARIYEIHAALDCSRHSNPMEISCKGETFPG